MPTINYGLSFSPINVKPVDSLLSAFEVTLCQSIMLSKEFCNSGCLYRQHHSMNMAFGNWFHVTTNVLILVEIIWKLVLGMAFLLVIKLFKIILSLFLISQQYIIYILKKSQKQPRINFMNVVIFK